MVESPPSTPTRVIVAALRLETLPTLAGSSVYFAMRFNFQALGTLKLMIDPAGDGRWQNSSAWGVECYHDLGTDCLPEGSLPRAGVWGLRVYPAKLSVAGVALFGLELTAKVVPLASGATVAAARVNVSGVAIAGIGARYHSLKTDDGLFLS